MERRQKEDRKNNIVIRETKKEQVVTRSAVENLLEKVSKEGSKVKWVRPIKGKEVIPVEKRRQRFGRTKEEEEQKKKRKKRGTTEEEIWKNKKKVVGLQNKEEKAKIWKNEHKLKGSNIFFDDDLTRGKR